MSGLRIWAAPFLWAALLLALGSVSDVRGPTTPLPLDKFAHLLLYGILGALAGRSWLRGGRRPAPLVVLALGLLVGALDELHQAGVPGRFADPIDWLMDAAGVLGGFVAAAVRGRRRIPQ